ncbi:MAG TPA: hypothetical protein H9830_03230, partial [Candidatus Agrococcus pullicola]|nr:hypothetical protein [Candidatus Agrococcus pullicola]
MRPYSLRAVRRFRQIAADISSVVGLIAAFIYAHRVKTEILEYAPLADDIAASGEDLQGFITGIADQARQIPLVGPSLADAFESSVGLPGQLASTGAALSEAIEQFGSLAWSIIVLIAVGLIAVAWLPWRIRFLAKSVGAGKLAQTEAGIDILAMRAIASGPVGAVLRAHPRPARAALEDAAVRDALATIYLGDYGHTLRA